MSNNDTPHDLKSSILAIQDVARDIRIIQIKTPESLTWQAGQFIYLQLQNLPSRPYSIANAPNESYIELHVKRGKGQTSNFIFEELEIGSDVYISSPSGNNIYEDGFSKKPVLVIAGGLGIAPIKAITDYALAKGHEEQFHLYWGTANKTERYLDEHFHEMHKKHVNFSFTSVTDEPVTIKVDQDFDDLSHYQIFISGPPPMISAALPLLLDKGAQREKISYDRHPEAANVKS